ncbi:MAG TPA: hypothetical protein VMM60_17700 [Ilumatobacter sp.]|nr:hypothetical protein [Ilumatobacter sp.]
MTDRLEDTELGRGPNESPDESDGTLGDSPALDEAHSADDEFDDEFDDDEFEDDDAQLDRVPVYGVDGPGDGGVDDGGDDGGDGTAVPLGTRVWRRIVRRPTEWVRRPWPNERIVKVAFTFFSLATTTIIMTRVVHLGFTPGSDLVFDDNTPTGGDFGAHVWGPAYLRDELLPSFRLNGWTMDWYGGMPAYRFYMVLPALAILVADIFLQYGVAMKFVSVLGVVTIPMSCWAFGRLSKFAYPIPELMAFAGLAFVLDESFEIYGGNLKSTMAGEFSFSIALSLAILGLGLLSAGLRTGKYRVWTAVVLAAACVSHGIVLIFVVLAATIVCLVWIDSQRIKYAVTVGGTTLLLMMWWVGPFLAGHSYMTDMKYGARPEGAEDSFWDMFFPLAAPLDILITTLAVIGFAMCILRRQLNGAALGVICIALVAGVYLTRDSLPIIGLLWNPRLLPFIYLVRYLLMVIGAFEVLSFGWNAVRDRRAQELPTTYAATAFAGVGALGILVVLGWVFQELPGAKTQVDREGQAAVYTWGEVDFGPLGHVGPLFVATPDNIDAKGDGWSRYNFQGYEGRDAYPEYHAVVETMEGLGEQYGCGRATWENNSDNGQYGTTMALMLLPHWTDGCIGSMEGLFFEASGTTPYHFLTAAAVSESSSNPVRELRYTNNDGELGVRHLTDLGVKYLMVRTDPAKAEADAQPELTLVAESGPWKIYTVANSEIVVPLDVQPVVVNERPGDQRERKLEVGSSWFQQPEEWAAIPADDGPADWQRVDVVVDESRHLGEGDAGGPRVDIVQPASAITPVPLDPVTISNIDQQEQSLSFDVDQIGVPVLVKVSYFPNWDISGADGPYRAGPNMMVVVPTDNTVEMTFGRSFMDYATFLLTLLGIGLCVLWRRQGDMVFASEMPGSLAARNDEPGPVDENGIEVYGNNAYGVPLYDDAIHDEAIYDEALYDDRVSGVDHTPTDWARKPDDPYEGSPDESAVP